MGSSTSSLKGIYEKGYFGNAYAQDHESRTCTWLEQPVLQESNALDSLSGGSAIWSVGIRSMDSVFQQASGTTNVFNGNIFTTVARSAPVPLRSQRR